MSEIIVSPAIDAAFKRAEEHVRARPRPLTTRAKKSSTLGILMDLCAALGGLRQVSHALNGDEDLKRELLYSIRLMEETKAAVRQYEKSQRKKLASDLRLAREKLRKLQKRAQTIEMQQSILLARDFLDGHAPAQCAVYPKIPLNRVVPTETGENLPSRPGIYFVRDPDEIVYVGQSINLKTRVTLRHKNIKLGDIVSYLEMDAYMLDFAEAFYIGVCKPTRNFGHTSRYCAHIKESRKDFFRTATSSC
jgi:hypothetical protein